MKEFVVDLLKNNLSLYFFYHNPAHTLYVLEKALEISQTENCSAEEIALLTVAVLWHDTGYIITYANHEEAGCTLARKYLPDYGLSLPDIEKVCGMIMATKIPQQPKNKLEQIIADADLEYLGTDSAAIQAENLYKELQYINPQLDRERWNQMQISFIQQHQYFTRFCIENREPVKQQYLQQIINSTL
jgi:uncharacterized protein